ncbi:helix-turn-helix transcriptional regulator [Pseudomonas fluorescens]|uniref:AlpA family phage regulatory protein n=1 Tax=Pseudomonas fluorescens TaxID=294 RepID=A0A5E7EYJ3_PSEFL|nr:hypothetical protein [Pseudomonas fluorescens]VVO32078.1 hypothetical protein PS691_05023 [Pseudomonas fluorescens]
MSAQKFTPETAPTPASATAYIPPFMPIAEALIVAGIRRAQTLYEWVEAGRFPAPVCIGMRRSNGYAGKTMFVREEVEQWVRDKIAEPRSLGPAAKSGRAASQPA